MLFPIMESAFIALLLFLIAAAYASVGLGGGTAYLAVLSFWDPNPESLRPLAWTLNVLCSGVVFVNYYRGGFFNARIAWPYLLGGIVGAALGASIDIQALKFQILLAATLTFISVQMLVQTRRSGQQENERIEASPVFWSLGLGLIIGFISGIVGIGGGILLGPVLIAFRWVDVKRCAAITSLYIFLSSLSALIMHGAGQGSIDWIKSILYGAAALLGGFLGSRYGSEKASPTVLKRIFAVIILTAAVNLLIRTMSILW